VKHVLFFGRANPLVSRIALGFHSSIDSNSCFRLVGEYARLVGEYAWLVGEYAWLIGRFALPKTRVTA